MTFARTKIQAPRPRPGSLIERGALEQRLQQALLTRRLVLLCAAAGFGKTSLLAGTLARLPEGTALAWVACDEGDSPTQLLECLLAALEPYDLPWRIAPEALVRAAAEATAAAQRRELAAELINALDAAEVAHGVIVVDDLHLITQPLVFEFVDGLLARFTPRWTLAIASRTVPPLTQLARLRAADELAEFRLQDLRFTDAEASVLIRAQGLPDEAMAPLLRRAEGWPAGLRLAINAWRSAPRLPGGHEAPWRTIDPHLFEFLATEVIARLEPALREFLLATAVLPEVNATRGAALSGDARAAEHLASIERAGLFATRLDSAEDTLRLHDLFRAALMAQVRREAPERLPELLRRAALTESDPMRRLNWLQRAEDWAAAEAAITRDGEALIAQGQGPALQALLERFPPERLANSPALQLLRAVLAWSRWDWGTALAATERAAALHASAGQPAAEREMRSYHCVALAGCKHPRAQAQIDVLLAEPELAGDALARTLAAALWMAVRGEQREVAPLMRHMLEALQPQQSAARWYECCPLPPMVGLPGSREPLQRFIAGAMLRLPEHPSAFRGMLQVVQGWLHVWRGEVAEAEACAASAAAEARWLGRPVNVDSYGRSLHALLLALRGERARALAEAKALVHEVENGPDPLRAQVYLSLYMHWAMRIAALAGDAAAHAHWAARMAGLLAADPAQQGRWLSAAQAASSAAHLAALRGQPAEAARLWQELLGRESVSDIFGQVVEARLRLAELLLASGRAPGDAAAVLTPLFDGVAQSGEWGAVLMAGEPTLVRLASADWGDALATHHLAQLHQWAQFALALRRVAAPASGAADGADGADAADAADAAAPANAQPISGKAVAEPAAHAGALGFAGVVNATASAPSSIRRSVSPYTSPAADPLSPRELEVLARIAAGDSNKLIARAFDLSPHTVKRHVANILDKLGLRSRGQAAAWFREAR